MKKIYPAMIRKTRLLLLPLVLFAASASAELPMTKGLYVGAISINPCQDARVLADWYGRLGIETKEIHGGYYAKIDTAAGAVAFAIHAMKPDAPKKSSASIAVVFHVENFDERMSALKSRGLLPQTTEKDDYGQFAHFVDPDGNQVTLWGK